MKKKRKETLVDKRDKRDKERERAGVKRLFDRLKRSLDAISHDSKVIVAVLFQNVQHFGCRDRPNRPNVFHFGPFLTGFSLNGPARGQASPGPLRSVLVRVEPSFKHYSLLLNSLRL